MHKLVLDASWVVVESGDRRQYIGEFRHFLVFGPATGLDVRYMECLMGVKGSQGQAVTFFSLLVLPSKVG